MANKYLHFFIFYDNIFTRLRGNIMKREEKWNMMYSLLVEYYKEYGDTEVPQNYVTSSGERLGIWVNTQRNKYRNNKLDVDREKKLRLLGFRLGNFSISTNEYFNNEYMMDLIENYNKRENNKTPIRIKRR